MRVKTQTWIRTAVLAVSLLNSVLTALGKNPLPFSEDGVYQAVSAAVTAAASLWAWWKNNSFTGEALLADDYLKELKENGL